MVILCCCVGVKPERLAEGMNPRHCALSLVGEPIMYPEINTLVKELHTRRISTFLVTNAQFPERITNLEPITQVVFFPQRPCSCSCVRRIEARSKPAKVHHNKMCKILNNRK